MDRNAERKPDPKEIEGLRSFQMILICLMSFSVFGCAKIIKPLTALKSLVSSSSSSTSSGGTAQVGGGAAAIAAGASATGGGPLAPTTFTISTNQGLCVSSMLDTTGIAATNVGGGLTTAAAGTFPAAGAAGAVAPTNGVTDVGALTALGIATTGSPSTGYNALNSWTATITVTSVFPGFATQACTNHPPYSAIACTLPTFTISDTDIASSSSLISEGYASNGGTTDWRTSNALGTLKVGIRLISDINGAGVTDAWWGLTSYNSKLYALGNGVYKYDPTGPTFSEVINHSQPAYPTVCNGDMYFIARAPAGDEKLYKYNDGGTLTQISNTQNNNTLGDAPVNAFPICINSKILWWANNNAGFLKLYKYDGAAFTQISDNCAGCADGVFDARNSVVVGTKMFAPMTNAAGNVKLYMYNDTGATLTQVGDTRNNAAQDDRIDSLVYESTNNVITFLATNTNFGYKLHSYDVATGYLKEASDTKGNVFADDSSKGKLETLALGGKVYVDLGRPGGNFYKVHEYNPATGAMRQISNTVANNAASDDPHHFFAYNNNLYFVAKNAAGNWKIFRYVVATDAVEQITNLNATHDIHNNGADQIDPLFTVYNGKLYFRANCAGGGSKLYVYDDSTNQVAQLTNIRAAAQDDIPWTLSGVPGANDPNTVYGRILQVYGTRLGFIANNANGFLKLWTLCDASAGCTP